MIVIDVFIALYLLFAWSWNLPPDSSLKRFINGATPCIQWLGIWHAWNMFAPSPDLENRRIRLRLHHANNEVSYVESLDLSKQRRWQAFLQVRERKYEFNLASSEFRLHRESLCIYAAKNSVNSSSQVIQVEMILESRAIAKPFSLEDSPVKETVLWTQKLSQT